MKVLGGDALVIEGPDREQQVKLYGIDCPGKGQPFWDKAIVLVTYLTKQKTVEVTPVYTGLSEHENVLVRVEGVRDYLNVRLVAYGMAWVKPNECSANLCVEWKAIEKLAQMKGIGLWAELDPVPPWEWKQLLRRRAMKHQNLTNEMPSSEPE